MNRRQLLWYLRLTPVVSTFRLYDPKQDHLPQLVAELEATYRLLIPAEILIEVKLESPKRLALEVGGFYRVCHKLTRINHWSARWHRIGITRI